MRNAEKIAEGMVHGVASTKVIAPGYAFYLMPEA
jgi:hypothetical protein